MTPEQEKIYLGKMLIERGFKTWFLYMFNLIESSRFIVEPLHGDLFNAFQDVQDLQQIRLNINIPPRAGKTTMATYFVAYTLAQNPRSNIIYTSYSQSLLGTIARRLKSILSSEIYQAMYSSVCNQETFETNPIDDFWAGYLKKEEDKTLYSNTKIQTKEGGIILFSSIGSAITGYGAGIRSDNGKCNGYMIIDDANKPADIHSEVMREKVISYFKETLISRLNNSNVPIVNIQQRLHKYDLSGFLTEHYKFHLTARPLVVEGVCQLPKQYNEARIKELMIDHSLFETQYQQNPIQSDQSIIKLEWIKDTTLEELKHKTFDFVYISCDTAQKTGKLNDYSAITVWGVLDNRYYVIDVHRKKLETPDLRKLISDLYFDCNADRVLIEDHANGTAIASELKRGVLRDGKQININLEAIKVSKDKAERLNACSIVFNDGLVYIPKDALWRRDFVNELTNFPNVKHDDQCDSVSLFLNWHRSRMKPMRFFSNY